MVNTTIHSPTMLVDHHSLENSHHTVNKEINLEHYKISSPLLADIINQELMRGNVIINKMSDGNDRKSLISTFSTKKEKLISDAERYFSNSQPAQRVLPSLSANSSQTEIIKQILSNSNGLIIGERHGETSGKNFIINNIKELQKNNVTTIFVEQLINDIHQESIDDYFSSPDYKMPEKLTNILQCLQDESRPISSLMPEQRTSVHADVTYIDFVEFLHKNNINVVALDVAASCLFEHEYSPYDFSHTYDRIGTMNFFASQLIEEYQRTAGTEKYIALVGAAHINRCEFNNPLFMNLPGLAEITGSIGVQIQKSDSFTIKPGEREVHHGFSRGSSAPAFSFTADFYLADG